MRLMCLKPIVAFLVFSLFSICCVAVEFSPELLERATAGDAEAQYQLALCYDSGAGVEKDTEKLKYWLETAALNGHVKAQYTIGMIYYANFNKDDDEKAARFFTLAAEQGDVGSQLQLGILYDRGKGVKKDERAAFCWYLKAAEQGNTTATYLVGIDYYQGTGVDKNYKEAARWLRAAGDMYDAKEILDLIEQNGEHTESIKSCRTEVR